MEPKRCQCTKVEVEWLKVLEAPTSYKNNCCIPFAELPHSLPSAVMSLSQITSRVCIFICHFTSCHFPLWIIDVWLWGDCPADWNTHSPLTVEKPLKMTWLEWTVQSRLVPHGLGQWGRWESSRLNSNLLVVKSMAGQDQQTQHRSYKNTVMWGTLEQARGAEGTCLNVTQVLTFRILCDFSWWTICFRKANWIYEKH